MSFCGMSLAILNHCQMLGKHFSQSFILQMRQTHCWPRVPECSSTKHSSFSWFAMDSVELIWDNCPDPDPPWWEILIRSSWYSNQESGPKRTLFKIIFAAKQKPTCRSSLLAEKNSRMGILQAWRMAAARRNPCTGALPQGVLSKAHKLLAQNVQKTGACLHVQKKQEQKEFGFRHPN